MQRKKLLNRRGSRGRSGGGGGVIVYDYASSPDMQRGEPGRSCAATEERIESEKIRGRKIVLLKTALIRSRPGSRAMMRSEWAEAELQLFITGIRRALQQCATLLWAFRYIIECHAVKLDK